MSLLWSFALLMLFCHQLSCWPTLEEEIANDQEASEQSAEDESIDWHETKIEQRAAGAGKKKSTKVVVVTPKNTVGLAGESVTLKCRGRSKNVQWHFLAAEPLLSSLTMIVDECEVVPLFIEEYEVDTTADSCNLKIDNLTLALAGTYTCNDNSQRSSTSSAELIVLESKPKCTSRAYGWKYGNVVANAELTCSVKFAGSFAPVMEWSDKSGDIISWVSDDSNESHVKTSIKAMVGNPTLNPYQCKTYFEEIDFEEDDDILVAKNQLKYTYTWKSDSVAYRQNPLLRANL